LNEKKGTMLNLDVSLVEQAKLLGINMSNVMNVTLKYLLEGSSLQPIRTDLMLVEQDIARVNNELSLRSLETQGLSARLEMLLAEQINLSSALVNAEKDTSLAKVLERIRSLMVTNVPLEEILERHDLINELESLLSMKVTYEWLETFKIRVMKNDQG
jgi:mRNA-degrading endonuclease YafQ of YafQ-DinJ toxin-antitoxin module